MVACEASGKEELTMSQLLSEGRTYETLLDYGLEHMDKVYDESVNKIRAARTQLAADEDQVE